MNACDQADASLHEADSSVPLSALLRSDEDLNQAVRIAEALDFRADLAPEERDYLEALAILIERFEDEHHPIPDVAGADMLAA